MLTTMKAEPILMTLLKTQRKHKKDYSWGSQKTNIANMAKYRRVPISRPTYNRWSRVIEDEGYFKRQRRILPDKIFGMLFKSTMYFIQLKGYILLRSLGYNVSREISVLIEKLKYKYPEFGIKATKKMLSSVKPNPKHTEHVQKIITSLADNLSATR